MASAYDANEAQVIDPQKAGQLHTVKGYPLDCLIPPNFHDIGAKGDCMGIEKPHPLPLGNISKDIGYCCWVYDVSRRIRVTSLSNTIPLMN